jgi:formylglycine-generating enzyme required for sulfatase activity
MKYAVVFCGLVAALSPLQSRAQQPGNTAERITRLEDEIESLKFRLSNLERLQGRQSSGRGVTPPAGEIPSQTTSQAQPTPPTADPAPTASAVARPQPTIPSAAETTPEPPPVIVPEPEPEPLTKPATFTNGAEMEMIWVPDGSYRMGDLTGNGNADEQPVRTVELSGFHLAATEVTQKQWKQIMGSKTLHFSGDNLPMERVNWEHALVFCRRLTEREQAAGRLSKDHIYHLPTEAQWEYACRAGTEGDFAGELDEIAWFSGGFETGSTKAVATKAPNAWGFYDMHGNVWEWCHDRYQDNYEGLDTRDPKGPKAGEFRVLRGGSWFSRTGSSLRSSRRDRDHPARRNVFIGFRVAIVPETPDLD